MATKTDTPRLVIGPGELARRLGVPTKDFAGLVAAKGYEFVELKPGGKPGCVGRGRWGMTEAQFAALLRGQSAYCRAPEPGATEVARPGLSPVSPDGKSRLKRRRG